MLRILLIILTVLVASFLLFFPFWPVGGTYYRGLLLIFDIRKPTGGNYLPPLPFERDIILLRWADPTSFEYVGGSYAKDRFSVYSKYRLDDFDPKTFREIQAPLTGEYFYVDKSNVRFYDTLTLKAVSGDRLGDGRDIITDKFDVESFQPLGANIFKDKNGVYTFSGYAPFNDEMNQRTPFSTIVLP